MDVFLQNVPGYRIVRGARISRFAVGRIEIVPYRQVGAFGYHRRQARPVTFAEPHGGVKTHLAVGVHVRNPRVEPVSGKKLPLRDKPVLRIAPGNTHRLGDGAPVLHQVGVYHLLGQAHASVVPAYAQGKRQTGIIPYRGGVATPHVFGVGHRRSFAAEQLGVRPVMVDSGCARRPPLAEVLIRPDARRLHRQFRSGGVRRYGVQVVKIRPDHPTGRRCRYCPPPFVVRLRHVVRPVTRTDPPPEVFLRCHPAVEQRAGLYQPETSHQTPGRALSRTTEVHQLLRLWHPHGRLLQFPADVIHRLVEGGSGTVVRRQLQVYVHHFITQKDRRPVLHQQVAVSVRPDEPRVGQHPRPVFQIHPKAPDIRKDVVALAYDAVHLTPQGRPDVVRGDVPQHKVDPGGTLKGEGFVGGQRTRRVRVAENRRLVRKIGGRAPHVCFQIPRVQEDGVQTQLVAEVLVHAQVVPARARGQDDRRHRRQQEPAQPGWMAAGRVFHLVYLVFHWMDHFRG